MNRIDATLAGLHAAGRTALIPYVTAGDPSLETSLAIMHALASAGADIIELGVPFSDPMADGPVVQRASERALAQKVGLGDVLALVRAFRERNRTTPVVLMGYANPIEAMGVQRFAERAAGAAVDGVLVVDYPAEEAGEWLMALEGSGVDPIFLLSPTTTDARIAHVARVAKGYIYYVSLKGVTGAANIDTSDVEAAIRRIRKHTQVPVGVGFGIRDGATAKRVAAFADAVVIGSRIVQELADAPVQAAERAKTVMAEFRSALASPSPLGEGRGEGVRL